MIRLALFLVAAAAIAFLAVSVADNPGRITLTWNQYRIETSVAVLIGAATLLTAATILLTRLWRFLWHGPAAFARERRQRRERRGYLALTQGLVAAAAGDARGARRLARRANSLLGEPPLTLLLSAQAAQLEGDEAGARTYFEAMRARPETEFLGLRGLLVEARKRGDNAAALDLAKRAYALKPRTAWVLTTLIDLQARAAQWRDAEATLKEAERHRALGHGEARHRRAVLLYGQGRALAERGLEDEALTLLTHAQRAAPGFVPAAAMAARLLHGKEKGDAARRLLEESWRAGAHPELAALYLETLAATPALERFKTVRRLTGEDPETLEGKLLLARAMMDAELWGLARSQLLAGEKQRPSARLYRLLAEIEEKEHGGRDAAGRYLARAAAAPADAQWVCGQCTAPSPEWQMHCYNCGAFDAQTWRLPPAPPRLSGPAEPTGAGAAANGLQPPSGAARARWAAWLGARARAKTESPGTASDSKDE